MATIRQLRSKIRVLEARQKTVRRKIAKASAVVNAIDAKRSVLEQKRLKAYAVVQMHAQKNSQIEAKIALIEATIANGGKRPRNRPWAGEGNEGGEPQT